MDDQHGNKEINSDNIYEALVETTGTGYLILDEQGRVVDANEEYVRLSGHSTLQDILGRKVTEWTAPDSLAHNEEAVRKCIKTGKVRNLEINYVDKKGNITPVEINATVVRSRIISLCRDISGRKKVETNLKKITLFLDSIVENIPNMIFVKDAKDLSFIKFNKAGEELLGVSRDQLLGNNDLHFFPKEQADFFREKDWAVLRDKCMLDIPEENINTKDLGTRVLHTKKIPLIDENGESQYLLGISEDITELKKSQKALQERESFFKDIAFSMADFIWETDEKGVYTYFSEKVSSILGYKVEELTGKTRFDLMHPQEAEKKWEIFLKITKNKEVITGVENWNVSKDGKKVCLLTNGVPMLDQAGNLKGYRGVDKDITERKNDEEEKRKLQQQLFLAEKIVAVGQLAGGIAHEINNPLMVISGFAQGIIRNIKEGDPLYMPLKSIEREVFRCKKMVQDLLTFARSEKKGFESMNINAVIEATLPLLLPQARLKNINIVKKYQADLPKALFNQSMLQRVIVNLCNNAIDATPDGGSITISTKKLKNSVGIDVADTGSGMSEKTKIHIFEPFFTTKDVGEGTGLGLSLCYEIIKNHNGTIRFETETGKGTVFYITLPTS